MFQGGTPADFLVFPAVLSLFITVNAKINNFSDICLIFCKFFFILLELKEEVLSKSGAIAERPRASVLDHGQGPGFEYWLN